MAGLQWSDLGAKYNALGAPHWADGEHGDFVSSVKSIRLSREKLVTVKKALQKLYRSTEDTVICGLRVAELCNEFSDYEEHFFKIVNDVGEVLGTAITNMGEANNSSLVHGLIQPIEALIDNELTSAKLAKDQFKIAKATLYFNRKTLKKQRAKQNAPQDKVAAALNSVREAEQSLGRARDDLIASLVEVNSKKQKTGQSLRDYAKLQFEYYKNSYECLEERVKELQAEKDEMINEALRDKGFKIPPPPEPQPPVSVQNTRRKDFSEKYADDSADGKLELKTQITAPDLQRISEEKAVPTNPKNKDMDPSDGFRWTPEPIVHVSSEPLGSTLSLEEMLNDELDLPKSTSNRILIERDKKPPPHIFPLPPRRSLPQKRHSVRQHQILLTYMRPKPDRIDGQSSTPDSSLESTDLETAPARSPMRPPPPPGPKPKDDKQLILIKQQNTSGDTLPPPDIHNSRFAGLSGSSLSSPSQALAKRPLNKPPPPPKSPKPLQRSSLRSTCQLPPSETTGSQRVTSQKENAPCPLRQIVEKSEPSVALPNFSSPGDWLSSHAPPVPISGTLSHKASRRTPLPPSSPKAPRERHNVSTPLKSATPEHPKRQAPSQGGHKKPPPPPNKPKHGHVGYFISTDSQLLGRGPPND